ncbi:hypothetical protein ES705_40039 [subsurface metagenome]
MEPDPKVAQEMHRRAAANVPHVPVQIKDPQISDVYHEVRIIRKWVVFIGVVMILGLVGAVLSIFSPV